MAVPALFDLLKDKKESVRASAAVALGKMKSPRAIKALASVLSNDELPVRVSAAVAMGEIGSPRAVKPLIKALSDKSGCVREAAASGLAHITGKNFGEDQVAWNKYWEENKEAFLSSCAKGLCRY